MRIEQLECVAAVTRHGSMRRASEALQLSQPALSQSISGLERELGVTLLDRHRAGARISPVGRELLPWITETIDAARRLRAAAQEQAGAHSVVRVGTVGMATATLVRPAIDALRAGRRNHQVELVSARPADVHLGLVEGRFDLGLVMAVDGDEAPADLETVGLLRGRAVVCCRTDSPLAALADVSIERLFAEPFVAMGPGYVLHGYAGRLRTEPPPVTYSADGAELGKQMVAEGLGVTLLPDFGLVGDPLERAGVLTHRPLERAPADVLLVARYRRGRPVPSAVGDLLDALAARAGVLSAAS